MKFLRYVMIITLLIIGLPAIVPMYLLYEPEPTVRGLVSEMRNVIENGF